MNGVFLNNKPLKHIAMRFYILFKSIRGFKKIFIVPGINKWHKKVEITVFLKV